MHEITVKHIFCLLAGGEKYAISDDSGTLRITDADTAIASGCKILVNWSEVINILNYCGWEPGSTLPEVNRIVSLKG